ncbi:MAG: arginine--tRNA ligase [Candidatus Parcubacteria bacterium]
MSVLDRAKQEVAVALAKALAVPGVSPDELVKPPQADMGDLSYPCFGLAKSQKSNPAALAKDLAAKIAAGGIISEARAAGPYVNFFFDRKAFATDVLGEVLGRSADFGDALERKDERIMIEYGSPNTHKEIHVGHLRNFCLGLSVVRLCRAAGYDVVPVSYIGDIGAHVAKCLWALKKFHVGQEPPENRGKFLGQIYTEATNKVEEDESVKEEIAEVLRKLEARDPAWDALWRETRQWSIDELNAVFGELGCAFERMYFESEVEGPGKALVKELSESGIAKEGERGAIIVDLESDGLGVYLVLKSDGSALYSTKELALAEKKFSDFEGISRSVHIVDNRQSLYFRQFFATLKRMGFEKKMTHLAYEFVTLKEGAMSSRKGNIVTYEDFRDEMLRMTSEETAKRHEDWSPERVREVSWAIAEGAMKFGMLKQDTERAIVFDMGAALSFDGFTGPYIQYAHARLSSILAKADEDTVSVCKASDDPREFALLRLIADLPATVAAAAEAYKPSLLAQYLFELAQASNDFYRDVPVLSAPDDDRCRRLVIVSAARVAIARGLFLLGIRAPEEM